MIRGSLFDPEIAKQLKELVDRADRDPDIRAVVFTGTHPDRFLSHPDVRWLQEGGTGFRPINTLIGTQQTLLAVLEGRPITPAEALSPGAVDELVPQEDVLARSIERAEYLGLRSKKSLGAIKRSIYFGSSLSLEDGCSSTPSSWSEINRRKLRSGCLNTSPQQTPLASSLC